MDRYLVALDQGTTSSRALLVDTRGRIRGIAGRELRQIYPRPGWVEHDPAEIWSAQEAMLRRVIDEHGVRPQQIAALGITNQRETTVVWDAETGEPVHNAIVWQDKRTSELCEELRADGLESLVREHTGLVIDAYFSATKIRWILDHVPGARSRAEAGELRFGTIDSWLIWKLTGGMVHATDPSNASRTLLYDIRRLEWDETLLERLRIPRSMLPEVKPSASHFGDWRGLGVEVPITGVAGDQQAALFGQGCVRPGMAKNTYGTGCFLLLNTGEERVTSGNGLLTTVAWSVDGTVHYALEGSVFIAGAAIQWLRDGLGILENAAESERLARRAEGAHDVYVVPAFAGLGAPHWDMYARGAIFGLTRDTGREHLVKATLESLAYQTRDVLDAMREDSGLALEALKVDGGAAANDWLMQFQADVLGVAVERPADVQTTALGAAYLAGLERGLFTRADLAGLQAADRRFEPAMDDATRTRLYRRWSKAVDRSRGWLDD